MRQTGLVLELVDARTRTPQGVRTAPGGVLRMSARLGHDAASLGQVRTLLVADMIRRVLEDVHTVQVLLAVIADDRLPGIDLAELMIRPIAGVFTDMATAIAEVGGPVALEVCAPGLDCADREGPMCVRVGPVDADPAATGADGVDPVAMRYALLAARHEWPARVDDEVLTDAGRILDHWRSRVAEWAGFPSAPVQRDVVGAARAAFDTDLDVARVLGLLRAVERDPAVSAGSKFETFSQIDQVLGFDLVRGLGANS